MDEMEEPRYKGHGPACLPVRICCWKEPVKVVQTDRDGEYVNERMKAFKERGRAKLDVTC